MGHHIHSPYLYEIARFVLPETASYYCYAPIEEERRRLLRSKETVEVQDYGTGSSGKKHVRDLAYRSLKPRHEAQLLLRLAVLIGAKEIVELGTSLGVTTAYLASVSQEAKVTTFEGAPALASLARGMWKRLGLKNIRCVEGNIDDTLLTYAPTRNIDLVYVDANHTEEATMRYFMSLLPMAAEHSIFVFDDIHANKGMLSAWRKICQHEGVTATFDLYSMGLVFFNPHFEKKTYKIRY